MDQTTSSTTSFSALDVPEQVHSAANHTDVTESLRKVSEEFSSRGIDFLRQQTQTVCFGAKPIIQIEGFADSSLEREIVNKPEAAKEKCVFRPWQAVGGFMNTIPV